MKNKIICLYMSLLMSVTPLCGYTTPDNPVLNQGVEQILQELNTDEAEQTFSLKAEVCTEKDSTFTMKKEEDTESPYYGMYEGTSHGNWAEVPELINFVNAENELFLAYSDSSTLYIEKMQNNLCNSVTLEIPKKFPLLGDVLCDNDNNFYVVWGQEDKEGKGNYTTMAISKYDFEGKHLKTAEFKTKGLSTYYSYMQTKKPFSSGSCDTIIYKGVLVTNFARLMYNGHQSNAVLAVNTSDMSVNSNYSNYVSHSFDQRVLATNSGEIIFANHGDAYPRGFTVGKGTETYFHFYGSLGNNYTYAQLGDMCDIKGTIVYSGVSAKSLNENAKQESTNLFIQIADDEKVFSNSSTREGTSSSAATKDNGILWITNYEDNEDARNPQMVKISNSRFVLLWEKYKNERYMETFYVVIDGDGKQISEITSLKEHRLNTFEPPVLKEKELIWVTAGHYEYSYNKKDNTCYYGYKVADGKTAIFHKVDMSSFIGNDSITEPSESVLITPTASAVEKEIQFKVAGYKYKIIDTKNKYVELVGSTSKNITSLKIKATVKYKGTSYKVVSVGAKAFKNYKKLKSVTLGKNVKTVGSYAFSGCKQLKKVVIGKNVTTIGKSAFSKTKCLKTIEIKSTKLTIIGKSAFKTTGTSLKVKVPKSKLKTYKKLLKKKGIPKETKFTY